MLKSVLPSQSRVWTVRADEPIAECVRILRDHSVGALVVLSDDRKEEIVGIFTERDLVRNLELIQRGAFWDTPVRAVMSANVKSVTLANLHEAPALMARHHIRHLPVIAMEGKRKRLVGMLSMRDVFRFLMEQFSYDLGRVYRTSDPLPRHKRKMMSVFSADPALLELADRGAKLTRHIVVKAAPLHMDFENLQEMLDRFDALFIDLDHLSVMAKERVLAMARVAGKEHRLFLAFSPSHLATDTRIALQKIAARGRVQLFSKPIALGLLFEKFLRDI